MPTPYQQLANLQPTFSKLVAARASENLGPIISKEVLASIYRHAPQYHDLAQKVADQLKYTDATQKAARAVREAVRPQLSEVARQAIESLTPKFSERSARAFRDPQLNLTRDILRADGLVSSSASFDGEAIAEPGAEPPWLARVPTPVLVALLCMWLDAIIAIASWSAVECATGVTIPPGVEDALTALATVAAAIAYTIHLRRSL